MVTHEALHDSPSSGI
jgi:hypothetical protein